MKSSYAKERSVAFAEDGNAESSNDLSVNTDLEKAILPALVNFMEKLDNEILKAYQNIHQNKIDYLQRLRDDNKFLFLCDKIQKFMLDFSD